MQGVGQVIRDGGAVLGASASAFANREPAGQRDGAQLIGRGFVSTFARWLIEEKGQLAKNPTRGIDLPAIQTLAPRQLSDDQRFTPNSS